MIDGMVDIRVEVQDLQFVSWESDAASEGEARSCGNEWA